MFNNLQEFYSLLPLIIIGAGILISVVIELYYEKSEHILSWFSLLLFLTAGFYSLLTIDNKSIILQNMFTTGGLPNIFHFIFNLSAAIICLFSVNYIKKYGTFFGEYYILLQTSVLGMMLMAGAKDMFVIFLGLEIMSISFYVLAGINRKRQTAVEASLKYFLLGAFATGFIVYGIALIYGTAQSTSLDVISAKYFELNDNAMFLVGVLLFLIGFSFKIAAFPFHMWVPDVYHGAPTTIAGLFSTAGKTAAFSAIIVSLSALFSGNPDVIFSPYLSVIAVLSMFFGSIVAIAQENIKRMLAYSSISHAGFIIIGLAAGTADGIAAVIFYLTVYAFMNTAAFGLIALLEGKDETNLNISSYSGLGSKHPTIAAMLAICMFSLAGIPPLAGFFAKYYIFIVAVKSNLTWLAILGVLSSVISVYFYLRVVVVMYFKTSDDDFEYEKSNSGLLGVMISVLLIIAFGILPGTLLDLIRSVV